MNPKIQALYPKEFRTGGAILLLLGSALQALSPTRPYNPSADAEVDLVILFFPKKPWRCATSWREDERALGTLHSILASLHLGPLILMRSRHLDVSGLCTF